MSLCMKDALKIRSKSNPFENFELGLVLVHYMSGKESDHYQEGEKESRETWNQAR